MSKAGLSAPESMPGSRTSSSEPFILDPALQRILGGGDAASLVDPPMVLVGQPGETVMCRGSRRSDGGERRAVLFVLAAAEHPSPSILNRLGHEYELRDELDTAWALKPLELVRGGTRVMLVLEDCGGEPLQRFIGAPMEVGRFLRLAIGIAMALGRLHQRGLVHKDIKPTNILVNAATGNAWLTGFGIATRLQRERQAPVAPEIIGGTLPYMAPEQTGRMNRSIDSRSDLYSLGVTFYQMLAGSLPFSATDPMDWVHSHIARTPISPRECVPSIPEVLEAIILKLLMKSAEDRYQTAGGVEADLRCCLSSWERYHQLPSLPIATNDVPDRLLIPEKLYGREAHINTLVAAFDRIVAHRSVEFVLISGYSGIGKSSVVNELHKVLVPSRGLFASGKFDQYKRDIPYSTLAQAFQSLVGQLLTKSDEEIASWRAAFLDALGPNAQLMVDLVPNLAYIVGETAPVPTLPPHDAQNRFQLVFRRFLSVFARAAHPLALFIDDLQWLDAATLELIEQLIPHPEVKHLLLVGAYRDNEVRPSHPLIRTLRTIRDAGGKVHEIILGPLTVDDVARFLGDSLRHGQDAIAPLARLVHEKTGGNPFFVIQFVAALAEEQLLAFDYNRALWTWELARIRAKGFTENVADLMAAKLARLPDAGRDALGQLACLGNVAEVAYLALLRGAPEDDIHADLWEAARAGLIVRRDRAYTFLHDRVQEAAYALIPEGERAATHLQIGRTLASRVGAERLEGTIFEIVSHLNRGAALITSQQERDQLAEFNLMAAKRAKRSTAYSSALSYLTVGRSLLTDESWDRNYPLVFAIELNRAECEILIGDRAAEQRLLFLSERASNLVDASSVACLRQTLYTTLDKLDRSVEVGLEYLTKVGIQWTAHPTKEEVNIEYDNMWRRLEIRQIEAMAELPRMQEPLIAATVAVLTELVPGAYFTDINLLCLVVGRITNLSFDHGNTDGSCYAYSLLGFIIGSHFGNYQDGFRFGRLALDLVDQPGLSRFRARVNLNFAYCTNPWSKHIRTGRGLLRQGITAALETGDLTFAAYTYYCLITDMLASGDSLDIVEREAQNGLEFASNTKFGLVVDILTGHLRLIQMLRGSSYRFGSFNDIQFDEAVFEQHLENDPRLANPTCIYWIRKLQGLYYTGDYLSAIAASAKAGPLLWTSPASFEMADYHFYAALAHAAHYDEASEDEQARDWQALTRHHQLIAKWADNCPENFQSRAALIAAEVARIEGRDAASARLHARAHPEDHPSRSAGASTEIARIEERNVDAMRLYEEAIRSAREGGFVNNEAIASELAGRFYLAMGLETNGYAHLRNARACFVLWGAEGKVRQLETLYPRLATAGHPAGDTVNAAIHRLDVTAVVKASQAVSGEIELTKLIERLMTVALENAGADRGLLILPRKDDYVVEAAAEVSGGEIVVRPLFTVLHAGDEAVRVTTPESLLRYVIRTHESVILDDSARPNPFAADEYFISRKPRSVFCLPLVRQTAVVGVLYLENTLTSHVFTSDRTALLSLLASQLAISLENTRLYSDLREREAKIRRLVDANVIGIVITDLEGQMVEANDAFLQMVGHNREELVSGRLRWTDLTPAEWYDDTARKLAELKRIGSFQPYEKEYFRKDGSRVPVLIGGASFGEARDQAVAFVLDLTERKRAEESLRELETDLAHMNRVGIMGELAASLAHEITQPIASARNNARAALNFLDRQPPELEEVSEALSCVVSDADRAGDIIDRIRDHVKKAPTRKLLFDLNEAINEVLVLVRSATTKNDVSVQTRLAPRLSPVHGDRVQLQQVIVNLILNAVEAMGMVEVRTRELLISTEQSPPNWVAVAVRDSGPGIDPEHLDRVFEAFYTTKSSGVGMGLSICRSIIDAHGGRLWAEPNESRGVAFHFTLPGGGNEVTNSLQGAHENGAPYEYTA
jgi:PAS domain S-box-containing protein